MARPKKDKVIAELRKLGLPVDPEAKYNDLCRMLKEATTGPPLVIAPHEGTGGGLQFSGTDEPRNGWQSCGINGMRHYRDGKVTLQISRELYDRARKQVGLSDELIARYTDGTKFKQYLNGISPKTNPDLRVKAVKIPKPVQLEDNMPDKFEFESKLEVKFLGQNRAQFDEQKLQEKLRAINRKYGAQKPVRIIKDMDCIPVDGFNKLKQNAKLLITKIVIYF